MENQTARQLHVYMMVERTDVEIEEQSDIGKESEIRVDRNAINRYSQDIFNDEFMIHFLPPDEEHLEEFSVLSNKHIYFQFSDYCASHLIDTEQ